MVNHYAPWELRETLEFRDFMHGRWVARLNSLLPARLQGVQVSLGVEPVLPFSLRMLRADLGGLWR